jgi:hypothetical protein
MENKYYITRDLGESAALLIKGKRLISHNWVGKICWFYFEDEKQCNILSDEYFFGELTVNARVFHEMEIRLKNRIFSTTSKH